MSGWGSGYITDIAYMTGWYRQQSPSIMALACLLGSVSVPIPGGDDPVHVLELGCGQGYGAMLLAASNPAWRVTGVDFNPAHTAAAREWAAEAGLANVTFIEADLTTLAGDEAGRRIAEADFVSLHGVWSWVPQAVQDGIVRLLRDKVRPGGAVHISYNSLPGWGPALGMQRLLREAGKRLAWRSDRQAEEGLSVVQSLFDAEAAHLSRSPFVKALMSRIAAAPLSYVAHEYMNEQWKPCFMADVAASLADAKLEWVASAQLTENFLGLSLTPEQQAVVQKFEDPVMRELVKDMCLERTLRHDVFVRGARRLSNADRDAALMDVAIGLAIDPDDLPLEATMPAGRAELNPRFYQPIARALAGLPARAGDLLALPGIEGRRDNPAELLGMMIGLNFAEVVTRPGTGPGTGAMHFNRVTARRFARTESLGRHVGLASQRTGSAVSAALLDMIVLEQVRDGDADIDSLMRRIAPPEDRADKVRAALQESLGKRMPMLRGLGVF